MKRISGRDVARAAGSSQATVSRITKADPEISRETREYVLGTARKLEYDIRRISGGWGGASIRNGSGVRNSRKDPSSRSGESLISIKFRNRSGLPRFKFQFSGSTGFRTI